MNCPKCNTNNLKETQNPNSMRCKQCNSLFDKIYDLKITNHNYDESYIKAIAFSRLSPFQKEMYLKFTLNK